MKHAKAALFPVLLLSVFAIPLMAAVPDTGTTPVRVTVSVSGPQPRTPVTARDLQVYQDSQRRPVIDWTPVAESPQGMDLAILIDDSLRSDVSLQFPDLRNFIQDLPASTQVGVAYADYGAAVFKQPFTTDHRQAAAALQIPEGKIAAGGSIYQSVSDLIRVWPDDGRVHVALVVSYGVDIWRGLVNTSPVLNPDLNTAIHQAQASGVTFYTIFAGSSVGFEHSPMLNLNGQSSLERLASETGGKAYFQGTRTPVSFEPFLKQLRASLDRQYVLTFEADARTEAHDAPLRVTTELPRVRITAPSEVRIPAAR
ncbi:MAG TPA: hypothetical protein VGZ29_03675 [Terriglobia bacterium]|nr:hypothetical protein [Terriglobia bacterium]